MENAVAPTTENKTRFFYVPSNLNLKLRLEEIGEHILAKPIHLDKFHYVIDSLYIRNVIRHNELTEYLGLHSRIQLKILTSRWSGKIKYLLVQIGVLEQNPRYSYRNGHSAKQFRFTEEFREQPFKRIQATDLKLIGRIQKAHESICAKVIGTNPVRQLIHKSVLAMDFDSQSATEWVAQTDYEKPNAKNSRNALIDTTVNRRNEYFSTDAANRFYHALVYLARDLRQFVSWKGKALYSVDVSNCQPALHATLYAPDCPEKIEYLKLVTTNRFYPFINSHLQIPYKLPEQKQLLKGDVFHYIFYGSRYAIETDMQKVFKSNFPVLHGIVLPENWTGGLDGESEETIIPSREIYETTT